MKVQLNREQMEILHQLEERYYARFDISERAELEKCDAELRALLDRAKQMSLDNELMCQLVEMKLTLVARRKRSE